MAGDLFGGAGGGSFDHWWLDWRADKLTDELGSDELAGEWFLDALADKRPFPGLKAVVSLFTFKSNNDADFF